MLNHIGILICRGIKFSMGYSCVSSAMRWHDGHCGQVPVKSTEQSFMNGQWPTLRASSSWCINVKLSNYLLSGNAAHRRPGNSSSWACIMIFVIVFWYSVQLETMANFSHPSGGAEGSRTSPPQNPYGVDPMCVVCVCALAQQIIYECRKSYMAFHVT